MGAALRVSLALIVCAGIGVGWYRWNATHQPPPRLARQRARAAAPAAPRQPTAAPAGDVNEAEQTAEHALAAAVAAAASASAAVPAQPRDLSGAPQPLAASATLPLEDLVARVAPAVVLIESSGGRGSGFFVQPDTIVTNAHVAGNDVSVKVHRASGDVVPARVEAEAADLDLAVLKLPSAIATQPVLPLGDVAHVRTGEDVVAIGSPLGVLQNSVTRGIVSAVRQTGAVTLVQTDAAINPGNSGGPLLDRSGVVVGVNAMGARGAQGISFAIAVDHVRELLAGHHVATTSTTPITSLNESLTSGPSASGVSDAEITRTRATRQYEQVLASLARRANQLDDYWRRFKEQCYEGRVAGNFDREWFAFFEPRLMQGAVSPGCGASFTDAKNEAFTIKNTVEAADEAARQADVYPGTRRDLRRKYKLDYAGWDR